MVPTALSLADPSARGLGLVLAVGFMGLEYGLCRLARHRAHDLAESAASFGVAAVQSLIRALEAGLIAIPFAFAHAHRLLVFDAWTPQALVALFFATELVYYWHHRASHRIRWLWATHSVHHSATRFNFTAAIRLGWTGNLSGGFLFFLPLVWLGFDPRAVVAMLGINLLYQFFLHTELVPQLGPLEGFFNTPAQHRVHHASNDACIDRNFGGVLSIFDHLFGTYAEKPVDEPLRYGVAGRQSSLNPARIALAEWVALLKDVSAAGDWHQRARIVSGPPGASPTPDRSARHRTAAHRTGASA